MDRAAKGLYFLHYGLTDGLLNQGRIIQDNTIGVPMEQPEVNIDESLDLSWAESIL